MPIKRVYPYKITALLGLVLTTGLSLVDSAHAESIFDDVSAINSMNSSFFDPPRAPVAVITPVPTGGIPVNVLSGPVTPGAPLPGSTPLGQSFPLDPIVAQTFSQAAPTLTSTAGESLPISLFMAPPFPPNAVNTAEVLKAVSPYALTPNGAVLENYALPEVGSETVTAITSKGI